MTHTQFKRVARSRISKIAVSAAIVTMFWGCQSPLNSQFNTENLKKIQHLLGEDVHVEDGLSVSVQGIPKDIEPALIGRMDGLDAITPIGLDGTWPSQITTSISGEPLSTTTRIIPLARPAPTATIAFGTCLSPANGSGAAPADIEVE